jgi:hypothetical protein
MAKSRDTDGPAKRLKARATGMDSPPVEAATASPVDEPAHSARPTRRQVRQIARLVARLEVVGALEARRRRQLQVALEKGRKTRRHRQEVDRAVGRVGELIDRLRTLARELDSPVPSAAPEPAAKPEPKATAATALIGATAASAKAPARRKPVAARPPAKAAPPRQRSKPVNT